MRSPITYIDNVRCPMLILQGEGNTRVAKVASDQWWSDCAPQERVLAFLTRELGV